MIRKTRLRPLKDEVIIFGEEPADRTDSGIFLMPSVTGRRPETGWIVAVGPGKRDKDGNSRPTELRVGNKVVFNHWEAKECKLDGKTHFIVEEKEILAILENVRGLFE